MSKKIINQDQENAAGQSLFKRAAKVLGILLLVILAVVILLGLIPASTNPLESDPVPGEL